MCLHSLHFILCTIILLPFREKYPMMISQCRNIIFAIAFFFFVYLSFVESQPFDYPTANLSTTWINSVSASHSVSFTDNSTIRAILLRGSFGPRYACGFFCNGTCDAYLFAVFIVQTNSGGLITMPSIGFPQVVWSANRNTPVKVNATLQLTAAGDLVLRDADGTTAWSTNTANMSVQGLNLTELGNLILFDSNNSVVWQSFDHPTDVLVPGQILVSGKNLTASSSPTNWTDGGLFSLSMTNKGLVASVQSDPPQVYYQRLFSGTKQNTELSYAKFRNGSLDLYINSIEASEPDLSIAIPAANSAQFIKFGSDGHLRVFEWGSPWREVADLLTGFLGLCNYPMVCGTYGVCSNGQCSCPRSGFNEVYFSPRDNRRPDLGCFEVNALTTTCSSNINASENHGFLDLENVNYFEFVTDISNTNMDTCKEACLRNCSCRAAIFQYGFNSSSGNCYLPSRVFSLMNNNGAVRNLFSSVSLKVQIPPTVTPPAVGTVPPTDSKGKNSSLGLILGSILGVLFVAVVVGTAFFVYRKRRKSNEDEEDYLDLVPGMPTRFCYEELEIATGNFTKKLGEGGFGSVFEGSLKDGTKIAVKTLDGVGHIKKSFLAEVESIGSIHHVNLVRLIGFCADKSHRLLVYEYVVNGSLEKWIYYGRQEKCLDWKTRRKIILDIAKGLAYLHEDCRQKIIHLDIKPQNILLDENFNAKLADFGLSKLIDRDQSQVVTTMRGTPGYLAPEWLSAVITEKVDVYSFGVVVLEIACGRKIFEQSKPEEERPLLSAFKKKAEEGQWLDLVENYDCDDNDEEIVEMMKIGALCVQNDYVKRPAMSMVIKVLEGSVKDVDIKDIDYNNFLTPRNMINDMSENGSRDVTPLLPSVLSGPR
ncbi:hypothetical protein ABFS82_08G204700 [Erythranthe guttata]|uniref:G-type lectin S-receptor-like serine/threonine-protein kinase SD2-5 n=1 Tax=Erythranthe guttata TaxID=4155 RepID=UPI00064DCFA0|nr:PREDICTED: G-type lectin S-receptor-like serine/threonine-protein kinase SD2-5 [Erythranthe guttata]|eukprot:XP_012845023.1 PREDICTED: G-type lectin S-receptor-like serine/threonine-protein kinase SD2-5 [Erythranthe guttata]